MAQNKPGLTPPPDSGPFARRSGPWTKRVSFANDGSFAFRPNQVVCKSEEAAKEAAQLIANITGKLIDPRRAFGDHYLVEAAGEIDVEAVLRQLAAAGLQCEPNYVLFAHASAAPATPLDCWCGCGCDSDGLAANPFFANSVSSDSVTANPFFANPFFANPFFANPFFANPFFANPFFANAKTSGVQPSSAVPAPAPINPAPQGAAGDARVIVLDTGIADPSLLPPLLNDSRFNNPFPGDIDPPDEGGDQFLDPASGHGTFVAGIVEQLAPGHETYVFSVLTSYGEGDVAAIANRIELMLNDAMIDANTIVNMSFGSYADEDMHMLVDAVAALQKAGAVVVASAGNDGTCRQSYPACLPDVVSVGSIDPGGRAFYSNHGPWVRACAPGTGLVSAFFERFDGNLVAGPGGIDPDLYDDWAQWTGTSFAAPVVTAALVRHMAQTKSDAATAVNHVIDGLGLFRYPGLGTVVNLAPGM